MSIRLQQHSGLPTEKQINFLANWIIVIDYSDQEKILSELPFSDAFLARRRRIGIKIF